MGSQFSLKNQEIPASMVSGDQLAKMNVAAEILATTQIQHSMATYFGLGMTADLLGMVTQELRGILMETNEQQLKGRRTISSDCSANSPSFYSRLGPQEK